VALLRWLLTPFQIFNDVIGWVGRGAAIVAIVAMVVAILVQVFFRYVLNNALPWPDEAARFCMLWMTGFMAPIAFRRGGFVAITMLGDMLPKRAATVLALVLLLISAGVLALACKLGFGEVTGFAGKFKTASLYVPLDLSFTNWMRVPRQWMMLSFLLCVVLLLIVNIELILRALIGMLGGGAELRPVPGASQARVD